MNIKRGDGRPPVRMKIAVRLWLMMMALVFLSIGSMWVVQIFLFEQNYVESAFADVQSRLEPIMEDLGTEDLAYNDKLIPYLSKSTSGKMMLLNAHGELISMYSYGHPLELGAANTESSVWTHIQDSAEYRRLLQGEQYKKTRKYDDALSIEIGIAVLYDGQPAYVILYHSLDEVYTVLTMNRRQLVTLSAALTVAAAILAAVLSRQFVKPIRAIKDTVDSLAGGDLEATPGLRLRDELGQLSGSVEKLGRALRRVDVLRKEVIANVSHELRSPLALISGYAEMVRDINWKDDRKREENLNLIIREAGRMSEMVSDIMDYSQFQAGYVQLKLDWYNLYDIVESEVHQSADGAGEHQIRVELRADSTDVPVRVDALKISQVMRNLLGNAVNHTERGETILVGIAEEKDGRRVTVANPGRPIPEEDREIIWERYQRSQHQGGRRQGTGIGLSIVSTILKAHGIPYGVDWEDGKTVFWFLCPEQPDANNPK